MIVILLLQFWGARVIKCSLLTNSVTHFISFIARVSQILVHITWFYIFRTCESVDESQSEVIQMKATEQYFLVVPFIMPCKVVITGSVLDKILKCDHSYESCWAVLSCGAVCFLIFYKKNFEGIFFFVHFLISLLLEVKGL